ncbi:MAG: recombinase-like helix-turn-helix domain-containing protein [Methylovirgula sp.]|uniref:recombinase-like helix-turn-helix domain-containing protein n=1 Tax=Methylovirgula sp. TaxID=1978224 RepID=UPI00307652FE
MTSSALQDVHARLAKQALARPLTPLEEALADTLEATFKTIGHDMDEAVRVLGAKSVARPSGSPGPWSLDVLESELAAINASLDAAYLARGPVEPDQS